MGEFTKWEVDEGELPAGEFDKGGGGFSEVEFSNGEFSYYSYLKALKNWKEVFLGHCIIEFICDIFSRFGL